MHRSLLARSALALALLAPPAIAQPAPAPPVAPPAPEKPGAEPAKPAPKPVPGKPAAVPAQPGRKPAPLPGDAEEPPVPDDPEEEPDDAAVDLDPDDEEPSEPPPGTKAKAPAAPAGVLWPEPGADAQALEAQGSRSKDAKAADAPPDPDRVYADDWWSHARPIFEIHGYFRVRAELFHNFSLGKIETASGSLWPLPSDNDYRGVSDVYSLRLCTPDESAEDNGTSDDPNDATFTCKNKTQAGANMRFRLNPELHISDNLRVLSQIDLLDNLVLGSTPDGYSLTPGTNGGYAVTQRGGYAPLGAFDNTQGPPQAGTNGLRDSIRVKRAWAEYLTPVGMMRFGRMPSHWGLGILANDGDGFDQDYQSTADRLMFVTGIKPLDLYFAGAWDFTNEGPTSDTLALPGAQPYDLGQLDDVDQYVFVVARRRNAELAKLELAQGKVVLNGGAYVVHRRQLLANDNPGEASTGSNVPGGAREDLAGGYVRRGAVAWIPDLWLQLRYRKFRFEAEVVTLQGTVENTQPTGSNLANADGEDGWKIRMWGFATEIEQRLVEDRLKLEFDSGWASGDPDIYGPQTGAGGLAPGLNGLQPQLTDDRTISTFRFHPSYHVDMILHRNLLTRVQGTYYFRPEVEYDFIRKPDGQRLGGNFAAIYTRASEFVQAPGHDSNLGIELDFSLYFQSKDGSLNDHHERMGGFYTMLQYGVLFPLAGLGYRPDEEGLIIDNFNDPNAADTSTAQILRWYLGVLF